MIGTWPRYLTILIVNELSECTTKTGRSVTEFEEQAGMMVKFTVN